LPDLPKSRKALVAFVIGVLTQLAALYVHLDYLGTGLGAILIVGGTIRGRSHPEQIQTVAVGLGEVLTEVIAILVLLVNHSFIP
jgi:hypothetical protein